MKAIHVLEIGALGLHSVGVTHRERMGLPSRVLQPCADELP